MENTGELTRQRQLVRLEETDFFLADAECIASGVAGFFLVFGEGDTLIHA